MNLLSAEFIMLAGGMAAFIWTVALVRVRRMREKYALTWIGIATLLLLNGIFPEVLQGIADASNLSYPAAFLGVAFIVFYVFAFSATLTLSRLNRSTRRMNQEIALMEERLRQLENNKKTD